MFSKESRIKKNMELRKVTFVTKNMKSAVASQSVQYVDSSFESRAPAGRYLN